MRADDMQKEGDIKLLSDTIKGIGDVKGFTFIKVKESDNAYIYKQVFNETGEVIGYEVFEKKVNRVFKCEKYPRSEAFGDWAYSCETLDSAIEYMRIIEERVEKRG